ncbi:cyclopropane-fatty-acyl-phospholipid synthase family protein [Pelomonas sp. APW6]|uniref:Cyclopropane-fatty-acyl-phospholipid synthase family protein n=1 Tax=Roseateles subflavus TaxID=3053353 RepID=A0ABT7LG43_9BURK|nr:cyclopropane-fatty-acyl-phospholipid synthase family protein [Pelomonas sp. APW6]MDL5031257.1 cyclopropane-fatty-acyl-phospholipid synthase family protein [Pelomonas sp. APW6]
MDTTRHLASATSGNLESRPSALRILARLLRDLPVPAEVRLQSGHALRSGRGDPAFTLQLNDTGLLRRLVTTRSPLPLVDAYFRGQIDVDGDLYAALSLKAHFERLTLPWRERLALLVECLRLGRDPTARGERRPTERAVPRASRRHTRASDRQAVRYHYDVSNAFYALWLDAERVYSCAYFETPDDTLEQAQRQKLDHICRKLRLRPGEHLLDIGCGWGALACWAARHHGAIVHGITLSNAQFEDACRRVAAEGLQQQVRIDLLDYRDLPERVAYDKVASIGMIEHVGLKNLPAYFAKVHRVLRPGGLFLNHGITHDEEGWNRTVATDFINRYVFPDGEFDCLSNIQLGMERCGFEIHDVEALRRHYALTLRHWVARLESRRELAIREVGETNYRIWRLYMAASALEFEAGGTGVSQILASRRGAEAALPLTRRDLYGPVHDRAATPPQP